MLRYLYRRLMNLRRIRTVGRVLYHELSRIDSVFVKTSLAEYRNYWLHLLDCRRSRVTSMRRARLYRRIYCLEEVPHGQDLWDCHHALYVCNYKLSGARVHPCFCLVASEPGSRLANIQSASLEAVRPEYAVLDSEVLLVICMQLSSCPVSCKVWLYTNVYSSLYSQHWQMAVIWGQTKSSKRYDYGK